LIKRNNYVEYNKIFVYLQNKNVEEYAHENEDTCFDNDLYVSVLCDFFSAKSIDGKGGSTLEMRDGSDKTFYGSHLGRGEMWQ
jgi:hypothetical protein